MNRSDYGTLGHLRHREEKAEAERLQAQYSRMSNSVCIGCKHSSDRNVNETQLPLWCLLHLMYVARDYDCIDYEAKK